MYRHVVRLPLGLGCSSPAAPALTRYTLPFTHHHNKHRTYATGSRNFYDVLGVKKDATQREIKSAYYTLSKKYHPDVSNTPDAKARFVEVSEAYDCLRDAERRRAYDNLTGGSGRARYTGDPFAGFHQPHSGQGQQQYQYRYTYHQYGNPFGSQRGRQFTQDDFNKIWEEFNRMRGERGAYDQQRSDEFNRQWEEMQRRRAERWAEFHKKYPDGPPGSIRWSWSGNKRVDWTLINKVFAVYLATFFVITLVQVIMGYLGGGNREIPMSDKQKIEEMMVRGPPPAVDPALLNYVQLQQQKQMPYEVDGVAYTPQVGRVSSSTEQKEKTYEPVNPMGEQQWGGVPHDRRW